MRMIKNLLGLVLICLTAACGGGGGDSGSSAADIAAQVRSLDLSAATGIVLTGKAGTALSASSSAAARAAAAPSLNLEGNSVYKVTPDGQLIRVPIINKTGVEVPRGSVIPLFTRDLDPLWSLFAFAFANSGTSQSNIYAFLVHKPTGYAYQVPAELLNITTSSASPQIPEQYNLATMPYQRDTAGNLYMQFPGTDVYRIDTSTLGEGNLIAQKLANNNEGAAGWSINPEGTLFVYNGWGSNGHVSRVLDLVTGSLVPLGMVVPGDIGWVNLLTGHDGQIYVSMPVETVVHRIVRDDNGNITAQVLNTLVTVDAVTGQQVIYGGNGMPGGSSGWDNQMQRIVVGGLPLYARLQSGGLILTEFHPEQGRLVNHASHLVSGTQGIFSTVKDMRFGKDYIYLFGTSASSGADIILRYDPVLKTDYVFDLPGLSVTAFNVAGDGSIWFEALRFSDQAQVVGQVDAAGAVVTILGVTLASDAPILIFEAIRPANFLTIDGSPQDWSLDTRVPGVGSALVDFSQDRSATTYYGLVEFNNGQSLSTGSLVLLLGSRYRITFSANDATILDLTNSSSVTLSSVGGIMAVGSSAVEFSLPLSAIPGEDTSTPVLTFTAN